MAKVYIPIFRQDYRDADQITAGAPSQWAGIEPNVFSPSLSGTSLQSASDANWIDPQGSSVYGADDFKDHKTLFIFQNTGVSASVSFIAGNTYAGWSYGFQIPTGETRAIWLDSSKFANKYDGAIKVTVDTASVKAYGVEMR